MIITYHGQAFVKVTHGDTTIAFNPPAKESGIKAPRFGADIVLVSMNDSAYNGAEQMAHGSKEPFVIDGPGEYEVGGIFIQGVGVPSGSDAINTIYTLRLDDIMLVHVGLPRDAKIPEEGSSALEEVDVLFLPLFGGSDVADAYALANALEPHIVVPLYDSADKKDLLKRFLKESGEEGSVAVEKLSLKKKDLEGKEGEVVVLSVNN